MAALALAAGISAVGSGLPAQAVQNNDYTLATNPIGATTGNGFSVADNGDVMVGSNHCVSIYDANLTTLKQQFDAPGSSSPIAPIRQSDGTYLVGSYWYYGEVFQYPANPPAATNCGAGGTDAGGVVVARMTATSGDNNGLRTNSFTTADGRIVAAAFPNNVVSMTLGDPGPTAASTQQYSVSIGGWSNRSAMQIAPTPDKSHFYGVSEGSATVGYYDTATGSRVDAFALPAGSGRACGVAVDGRGNVYISDCSAALVRKFTPDGTLLTTIATQNVPVTLNVNNDGTQLYVSYGMNAGIDRYTSTLSAPAAPTAVTASATCADGATSGDVVVSWQNSPTPDVTQYTATLSAAGAVVKQATVQAGTTTTTFSGVPAGSYDVAVTAVDTDGQSPAATGTVTVTCATVSPRPVPSIVPTPVTPVATVVPTQSVVPVPSATSGAGLAATGSAVPVSAGIAGALIVLIGGAVLLIGRGRKRTS